MHTVRDVVQILETFAPPSYQESYDNAGLIVGSPGAEVRGILLCLDSTEEILDEAIQNNCNLVIAHHPIIFSGLKKITGKNYVERTIIKAIKNDIAIYAAHTNLDNVRLGVNDMIARRLGLQNCRILDQKQKVVKQLHFFVPVDNAEKVKNALFEAGAGRIGNYTECSFETSGQGSFKPEEGSDPTIGNIGTRETVEELRVEMVYEAHLESKILDTLFTAHPYEEVAYGVLSLDNKFQYAGSGMIGNLAEPMDERSFLLTLKESMNTPLIRHTKLKGKQVQKVAVCGGAGSFLLQQAISAGADIFITGDFKYHQFFDAEGKIVIADIGHYESEQFTVQLFYEILREKFNNFALRLAKTDTNPIKYL